VLEAAVDGLGRAVGCAGPVEVGEDVDRAAFEGAAEGDHFVEVFRDGGADRVDRLAQLGLAGGAVGVAVGGDDALVDAPRCLDLDVPVVVPNRSLRHSLISPQWWLRDSNGRWAIAQLPNPALTVWLITEVFRSVGVLAHRDTALA
jgi:hypothetical protein